MPEHAASPTLERAPTTPPVRAESPAPSGQAATEPGSTRHSPQRGVSIDRIEAHDDRPVPVHHVSAPAFQSPLRHHQRTPSRSKGVKETLNARTHYGSSEDDGTAVHRINQYVIKQEIGRGSFGAVHLAVDQYGQEYAVKEFSKARLRKRAQSNLLRRPHGVRRPGALGARPPSNHNGSGIGSNLLNLAAGGLHRLASTPSPAPQPNNSLDLIKEEIAIMKKLHHPNLVSLIEVLDDPSEDSLYMVLEMCKKGVVMKLNPELNSAPTLSREDGDVTDDTSSSHVARAEPYPVETCRCWFRDMILGIEYLHAQGIIHRDIKPDNCLITADDVLKIVDFGVSEMFEKTGPSYDHNLSTTKSAGSPAFMPPELCVARHGAVSGRAADIWSMGVTLFCLRYGHIPFESDNVLELYNRIREQKVDMHGEDDPNFQDLMLRLLEKDPEKRIKMEQLRVSAAKSDLRASETHYFAGDHCADRAIQEHPWVTANGTDPLLSAEENCAVLVDPPTEQEMNHAITGNMENLLVVMKAVRRFKTLASERRQRSSGGFRSGLSSILGGGDDGHAGLARFTQPPGRIGESEDGRGQSGLRIKSKQKPADSQSLDTDNRQAIDSALASLGVHRDFSAAAGDAAEALIKAPSKLRRKFLEATGKAPPRPARSTEAAGDPTLAAQDTHEARGLGRATTWNASDGAGVDAASSPLAQVTTAREFAKHEQGKDIDVRRADQHQSHSDSPRDSAPQCSPSASTPPAPRSPRLAKARTMPIQPLTEDFAKGHAHDPLMDILYLRVGAGTADPFISHHGDTTEPTNPLDEPPIEDSSDDEDHALVVSESPSGLSDSEPPIYETAYQESVRKILAEKDPAASLHLTRRVEHIEDLKTHPNIAASSIHHGVDFARRSAREAAKWMGVERTSSGLAEVVRKAAERAETKAREKGILLGSAGVWGLGKGFGEEADEEEEHSTRTGADKLSEKISSFQQKPLLQSMSSVATDLAQRFYTTASAATASVTTTTSPASADTATKPPNEQAVAAAVAAAGNAHAKS